MCSSSETYQKICLLSAFFSTPFPGNNMKQLCTDFSSQITKPSPVLELLLWGGGAKEQRGFCLQVLFPWAGEVILTHFISPREETSDMKYIDVKSWQFNRRLFLSSNIFKQVRSMLLNRAPFFRDTLQLLQAAFIAKYEMYLSVKGTPRLW